MQETILTAFAGHDRLLSGPAEEVAVALWKRARRDPADSPLLFDEEGRQVDLDLSGTEAAVRAAAYRFMSAIGGDLPGFEEAARALYAGDAGRLRSLIAGWPRDVRDHALRLARIDAVG